MSTFLTSGIVLNQYSSGEYDRQYVIYTKSRGKLTVLLKGAQKPVSKLAGHLEIFSLTDLMLAEGANFIRLAGAVRQESYRAVRGDLVKSIMAAYFLEAVNALVKQSWPDEPLFAMMADFLSALAASASPKTSLLLLNKFSYELLSHLGYRPTGLHSRSQQQLLGELHGLLVAAAEREIKSFKLLAKIVKVKPTTT